MSPKLSIIIPCYNCEKTLREAVDSCYVQGFSENEFEIVMVDDGSTDETRELMKRLAEEHANLHLFFHEKNKGGGAARNTAVANSKSEVIFCLDSDDLLPPDTLNRMLDYLDEKQCDGICFEKSIKFRNTNINNIENIDTFPYDDNPIPFLSLLEWKLSPVVVVFMYTKKSFNHTGGYPTNHGFDTQGFGWRFLSSGLKAYVCPGTSYLHRVNFHQSYYLREYNAGKVNLNMRCILYEHLPLFSERAQNFITTFNPSDFTKDLITELKKIHPLFDKNLEQKIGTLNYLEKINTLPTPSIHRNSLLGLWFRIKLKIRIIIENMPALKLLLGKIKRRLISLNISLYLPKPRKKDFSDNYHYAKSLYEKNSESYKYDKYLMSDWKQNTNTIEKFFLNDFSLSFLRHHLIKSTMFAHLPKEATSLQKKLLESFFPKNKLGEYLKENSEGNPILNDLEYKTSGNIIHHLYHLAKLGEELGLDINNINSYTELGGGYGNMAKIAKRINPDATYTIIDIPIFIFIQYVYLSTLLGKDSVVIFDGTKGIIPHKVNLIPLDEELIKKFIDLKQTSDIFISTWALSESNQVTQSLVRDNNYFNAKYLLLAYQQANSSFQFSQDVVKVSEIYNIKYNSVTEYMPDNYYLFAERK